MGPFRALARRLARRLARSFPPRSRRAGALAFRLALVAFAALLPTEALAQDPADLPTGLGTVPTPVPGVEQAQRRPFWISGQPRFFAAATLEAGFLYFRPQLSLGFGKPHWHWFGLDGNAGVGTGGGSEYLGLRYARPAFELRAGGRYVFPLDRNFLQPREKYTRDQTEHEAGPPSNYLTTEAEAIGALRIPTGSLFGVLTGVRVWNVPEGYYVFEESLKVVVKPDYVWRIRAGYFNHWKGNDTLKVGLAAEAIGIPERGAVVTRMGPVVAVSLTHHLEAIGAALFVVSSPDNLGFFGTDISQLGVRYRWATGDRWPEFP